MIRSAGELLSAAKQELAPAADANRLIPLITEGRAARSVFGVIATEETRIVRSGWRSCLTLAARSEEPNAPALFAGLAEGENVALDKVAKLAEATGMGFDDEACGFFDFFATPTPEVDEQVMRAAQAGIDAGRQGDEAMLYGRLFLG